MMLKQDETNFAVIWSKDVLAILTSFRLNDDNDVQRFDSQGCMAPR